ncbi:MAG: hypothetical protein NTW61_03175 [Candidatus Melainabacteria bacterium]|nr:hypothetical protein [Candidatus Melainabacteria bacterium]
MPEVRQAELRRHYPWLRAVAWNEGDLPSHVSGLAVSAEIRTARHAKFCALLVAGTPVLSFAFRRRAHDRTIFREFTSSEVLYKYCTPNGGTTLKHRQFQVVLPELGCAFFESWDDTHHFYFNSRASIDIIRQWAEPCGLYLLDHG